MNIGSTKITIGIETIINITINFFNILILGSLGYYLKNRFKDFNELSGYKLDDSKQYYQQKFKHTGEKTEVGGSQPEDKEFTVKYTKKSFDDSKVFSKTIINLSLYCIFMIIIILFIIYISCEIFINFSKILNNYNIEKSNLFFYSFILMLIYYLIYIIVIFYQVSKHRRNVVEKDWTVVTRFKTFSIYELIMYSIIYIIFLFTIYFLFNIIKNNNYKINIKYKKLYTNLNYISLLIFPILLWLSGYLEKYALSYRTLTFQDKKINWDEGEIFLDDKAIADCDNFYSLYFIFCSKVEKAIITISSLSILLILYFRNRSAIIKPIIIIDIGIIIFCLIAQTGKMVKSNKN